MTHPTPRIEEREDLRPAREGSGATRDGGITRCEWCGAEYPVPEADAASGAGCGRPHHLAPPAATSGDGRLDPDTETGTEQGTAPGDS